MYGCFGPDSAANSCITESGICAILEERFMRGQLKNKKKAIINFQPLQPGDVNTTFADVDDLIRDFKYKPKFNIETGISRFIEWYKEYYKNDLNV